MKKAHQHFIPRIYLRNFAHRADGEKHFVCAYNKQTGKIIKNMSIKDVCVDTDLYTLDHLPGAEKYKIEDFFSENIESKYRRVYELLVKDKKQYITAEERSHILYTTLSMYFRTPKVLNNFVKSAADLIYRVKSNPAADTIDFMGKQISLRDKSFEQIKNEIREHKRIDYVHYQLALLNEFVRFRALDGLVVTELVGDQEYITSDNPVEIRNATQKGNLQDPGNSIYVPLDSKHALFIAPRFEGSIVNQVFYQRDNFFQHAILNNACYENAERWVIGRDTGIAKFLKDQERYTKPAGRDNPIAKKMQETATLMITANKLASKGVNENNKELVTFMKDLQNHELYKESIVFQDMVRQFKEMGFDI